MKKLFPLALFFLLISLKSLKAEPLNFLGYIKCYKNGTQTAEYALLQKGLLNLGGGSLANVYQAVEKSITLTQTQPGKCYLNGTMDVYIEKPVLAFALLKALADIYGFQYIYNGNLAYKPSFLVFFKKDITLKDLIAFLTRTIKKQNPKIVLTFLPKQKMLVISSELLAIQSGKKGCEAPQLGSYIDICQGKTCKRYILNLSDLEVEYKPYFTCKNGTKSFFTYQNSCQNNATVAKLYLDNANLIQLLKVFEKFFNINFVYDTKDLKKVKNSEDLHLIFQCLTAQKALKVLKKDFHLYEEQLDKNVYRILADKDAYSVVLQRVSDQVAKVLYLKNISAVDFLKILELYYGKKVLFTADPTFNAVTLIGPQKVIKEIEKKFAIYIRHSNEFDSLMTKIFYVKYGDINKLQKEIQKYLSQKGIIKVIGEAQALEITDYPTNLAMVEKVFGKFLSQRPVKIKVIVKFVRINKSFARSLGINWSFTYSGNGKAESVVNWSTNSTNNGLISSVQFAYRKLNPLSLQIAAAESVSLAKTLSSPSLVLLNGQSGNISSGVQIPYQAVDQNGNPTTNLVSASLTLNVTPQLLPDGRILLNLQLSKNSPNTALAVNGQPAINTFTITQNFIVANGETLVIGGVLERTNNSGEAGTPILKNIPLLGWLFKTKNWDKQDDELMVFITAKVVNE